MVRYKWYIVPAEPCSGQSGHAPSGRADRILYLWEDIAMTITKNEAGGALRIALTGRLDTNTAPQLETELKASLSASRNWTWIFPAWSTSPPPGCGYCWRPRRL